VPGTTPNTGLTYPLLADAADIEAAVKTPLLQIDAMRLGRRALSVSAQQVLEVGQTGQIRAGRQLTAADFTNMGLAAPLGLWNLSDLTDASGNARALTNKGTVPFGVGINGSAATAAQFAGSTAQALYRADTGAADPFRIRTGSMGCWFRTAKRGTNQVLMGKHNAAVFGPYIFINPSNVAVTQTSTTGVDTPQAIGTSDVADDRWHFVIVTNDGTKLRLYLDGALDGVGAVAGPIWTSTANQPFNIGGVSADASVATVQPFYGRIDEAFVAGDVLSDDEVRNLYCASITHGLTDIAAAALTPRTVMLKVRRRRRGGALATTDFPAAPVRLHNFTAGALTDQGSGAVALTSNPGTGAIVTVAAPDGVRDGAYSFSGAHTGLSSTDAGLPAALAARSYGAWFKTTDTSAGGKGIVGWGTMGTADTKISQGANQLFAVNGADSINGPTGIADGLWHQAVVVEDNAAADGVKRKLYLDGRLVGASTVLNTLTLAGANRFRVGAQPDGTVPLVGQADGAFVYAGALTPEQVRALYNVGSLALAASPKSEGDHVEAMEATRLLATFDSLEGVDQVDLEVMA
jgi:hypothetical protein